MDEQFWVNYLQAVVGMNHEQAQQVWEGWQR